LHLAAVIAPGFLRVSARAKSFEQRSVQELVGLHQDFVAETQSPELVVHRSGEDFGRAI
jgi:hypothetical protein